MPLSGEEIPSLSLYSQGEESSEEYRQPIHEIYHLVQIDVSSQKYHTVFNRQGEPVALMDMRPIWSNMIYLAERNAFLILCEDHNPMHNLEACDFRLAGRELLIEVDLDEKEISALYVSGREMPDYDELWTYCWKMYGTKHGNGATYTPLMGDELTRFHELITGKPLRQENHSAIDQWFTMPALAYEIKSIDQ